MSMPSFNEKNIKKISPRRELQGPRPPPLKVNKESCMIKKPSRQQNDRGGPVVIHLKSPDIIHTRPQDFMELVQKLTGKSTSSLVSSSSSSSLSSSSYSYALQGGGSVSVMVEEYTSCEIISSIDLNKGQENNEVKEDHFHMGLGHGVSSSMSPQPSMPSTTSPVFPNFFLSSPNAFKNWPDVGPVH